MKKIPDYVKNMAITAVILCLSFGFSLLLQYVFEVHEHITTVFVFAVFLISLLTRGYAYGILSSFAGMIAVNYAFTFPYFAFNFTVPVNVTSAIIMIVISVLTSALTTKLKLHEMMKAESEKERMRANLLRAVSHDLRTPLTTIYGASTTLLEHGETMTAEHRNNVILGIKEDSEWLVRMVENLLSITRIDSGTVKIIKTPTVLEELVDSVLLKFKKRYDAQEVMIDIPDDVVIIPMDAILIEQVIVNILENAVQHAAGMTELSLRVFTLGKQAIFEIQDNGCGIPQERMNALFTGYYKQNETVSDGQTRSAGIGLSVCATIIKAHGGDIKAENLKAGGAVFRFTLDTEDVELDEQ
ncbi:MAG: PAS domain-containing sensor histidine kinase [Clostridia bacterium]|nr:PAS domain-containing sensor histidine kinase [Clostridia bacterium]